MNAVTQFPHTEKYARCIQLSKNVRWEIDADVIRGRSFDTAKKYLPDGLSLLGDMDGLTDAERRFASQVQGRTYANIFGMVERYITAKMVEIGAEHSLGDQTALEAMLRFSQEELKHQDLFRRIEAMMAAVMPAGYRFDIDPSAVAAAVLGRSHWAVLLLTLHIELFVQKHYRESIEPDAELSELFKDVFLYHWKDECQHVLLDELEMKRHDATLSLDERERGVDDFIDLVAAVDGILQLQAKADATYFATQCGRKLAGAEVDAMAKHFLAAYRWQYILSGADHPRFRSMLGSLVNADQGKRIAAAVAGLR